jgi:hypothetical protein
MRPELRPQCLIEPYHRAFDCLQAH